MDQGIEARPRTPAGLADTSHADGQQQLGVLSRRLFIRAAGGAGLGFVLYAYAPNGSPVAVAQVPGHGLDPRTVPKYQSAMLIPPVMPRAAILTRPGGKPVDYYEISMRQFEQQILPAGFGATTVWGYGPVSAQGKKALRLHHAPSLTIEASHGRPVRVKWVNELVDSSGDYLPHLLPVDPTLHWANPPGGLTGRDSRPGFTETPERYAGPVPMVTHLHGAVGVGDESDGYPQAWYLPAARNIPDGHATNGAWHDFFAAKSAALHGTTWGPGYAVSQYPNPDRAGTKWYHDHSLGLTRLNVYAGPAGFYLVRGGPDGDKAVVDTRDGSVAVLPGPAPREGDRFPSNKAYREIAIAIQDRSFHRDGSLAYPDTRELFDGIVSPYIPAGPFPPIWNPEFFGDTIMVNGRTWPFTVVEQRRYRFRFLNGCQSRFLILDFGDVPGVQVWAIGNEGGFLATPVSLTSDHDDRLLLGPAERADLIVDFTQVPLGSHLLRNVGPDEPFGGGEPAETPEAAGDFDAADPDTTGQILQFRVVAATTADPTTPPEWLQLPALTPLPVLARTRELALVERVAVGLDADGNSVEGPVEALLGTVEAGRPQATQWRDPVTENPDVGDTEVWEIYNTTADAHPMHVHEVAFEVVNRQGLLVEGDEVVLPLKPVGEARDPEPWETGVKDTVVALPGEVTRIRAQFGRPGQFVWHCHIVEHEDNEMMRPYRIGPVQPGQPG